MFAPYLSTFFSLIKRGLKITKKIIIVLLVYMTVFYLFYYFINKDKISLNTNNPTLANRKKIYAIINRNKNNEAVSSQVNMVLFRSFTCYLIGEACTDNPKDGDINVKNSAINAMSSFLITPLTHPPASGIYWAYSGLQNASFIPKTYAAEGIGFAALGGFKQIWLLFRNFVMLLMVLVIITIGFMIMFRTKINPQTVISIESSLPKIVIALLLITFSFAIAGFLIDLMYISIGIVVLLFKTNTTFIVSEPADFMRNNVSLWKYLSPFGNNFEKIFDVSTALYSIIPGVIQGAVNVIIWGVLSNLIMSVSSAATGLNGKAINAIASKVNPVTIIRTIITKAGVALKLMKVAETTANSGTPVVGLVAASVSIALWFFIELIFQAHAGTLIIVFLLILSMLFIYFRIFFMLIGAYLGVILLVIFSPLILSLEAVPGKSAFSNWIKNLFINLATFPIFVTLILVAQMIINLPAPQANNLWKPPFLFSLDSSAFQTIVGGVIMFAIPDLIKQLKEATGIKPLPLSLGFGSMFSGATSTLSGGMGLLGQFSSINLGLSALGIGSAPGGKTGLAGLISKFTHRTGTAARPTAEPGGDGAHI